jgi:hypothetical protein
MKHLQHIPLKHLKHLKGGDHYVRRVDWQIGAERQRSEEHDGLGCSELLPLVASERKEPRDERKVRHGREARRRHWQLVRE